MTANEGTSRVTGVVWWKVGKSHFKALYRRGRVDGYTKDFLQAPRQVRLAFDHMFMPNIVRFPLAYLWPGGSFEAGEIYQASDSRYEVGQWTKAGAPHPWAIGDPETDPLITLRGDPDAEIPEGADREWDKLEPFEPWLVMVQLEHDRSAVHLRAYLRRPPDDLSHTSLQKIPESIRGLMTDTGGVAEGIPPVWFDPEDFRDPWRVTPDQSAGAQNEQDIAVSPGDPVGIPYVPADENPSRTTPEPFEVDPNEYDRSSRAHSITQNALAELVERKGWEPLTPAPHAPKYDLAWAVPAGGLIVAEVKSIGASNAERQMRLGLGQVLRYRNLLSNEGDVRACLVLSEEPYDPTWESLCRELGVGLIWRPELEEQLDLWMNQP